MGIAYLGSVGVRVGFRPIEKRRKFGAFFEGLAQKSGYAAMGARRRCGCQGKNRWANEVLAVSSVTVTLGMEFEWQEKVMFMTLCRER